MWDYYLLIGNGALRWATKALVAVTLLLAILCIPSALSAEQIDLRLDVNYAGAHPAAGGAWQLFAKSDGFGIFSLGVDLIEIDSALQFALPTGTVNGSDNAGFAIQLNNAIAGGRRLIAAQQALGPPAVEQGAFYGVGTLTNGSPDFPGALGGTNQIGPTLTSLTGVQNIPWATTDPVWSTGVSVASGTFSAGDTPSFGSSALFPSGSVFTSLGTVGALGAITNSVAITTQINTNLSFGVATGDYDGNGTVDSADYTLWRDTFGQSVASLTGADGSGNGLIDIDDYNVWKNNYGSSGPAVSAATSIPEPCGAALAVSAFMMRTFRRLRQV